MARQEILNGNLAMRMWTTNTALMLPKLFKILTEKRWVGIIFLLSLPRMGEEAIQWQGHLQHDPFVPLQNPLKPGLSEPPIVSASRTCRAVQDGWS